MTSIYTTWDPARAAQKGITIYNNNQTISSTSTEQFFQTEYIDINPYLNNGNTIQFTVNIDEYKPSKETPILIGLVTNLTTETKMGGYGSFGFRSDGIFVINGVEQDTQFPPFFPKAESFITLIVYPNDQIATLNDGQGNISTYSIADLYNNIFNSARLAFTPNDAITFTLSNTILEGDNHDGVISILGGILSPPIVYPPYRQILNLQPDGFFYLHTSDPVYTTHTRMISIESIRIVLRESANKIESYMIYFENVPLIMIPYQSAITNYSATIQSSSIGISIQEPAAAIMPLVLYYISSVDGQTYVLTDFYQCTASFVTYNYQA
jgi:hypothetical protein